MDILDEQNQAQRLASELLAEGIHVTPLEIMRQREILRERNSHAVTPSQSTVVYRNTDFRFMLQTTNACAFREARRIGAVTVKMKTFVREGRLTTRS